MGKLSINAKSWRISQLPKPTTLGTMPSFVPRSQSASKLGFPGPVYSNWRKTSSLPLLHRPGRKLLTKTIPLEAIDRLVQQFSIPLESAGADIREIHSWVWSSAAVRYHVHFTFYIWLPCCVVAAVSCTMCLWMDQHIDYGGASASPPCFKWESRESSLCN